MVQFGRDISKPLCLICRRANNCLLNWGTENTQSSAGTTWTRWRKHVTLKLMTCVTTRVTGNLWQFNRWIFKSIVDGWYKPPSLVMSTSNQPLAISDEIKDLPLSAWRKNLLVCSTQYVPIRGVYVIPQTWPGFAHYDNTASSADVNASGVDFVKWTVVP